MITEHRNLDILSSRPAHREQRLSACRIFQYNVPKRTNHLTGRNCIPSALALSTQELSLERLLPDEDPSSSSL